MRINIISNKNNYAKASHPATMPQAAKLEALKTPYTSIYQNSGLPAFSVSFAAIKPLRKEMLFIFTETGIVCPYSGIKMVPGHLFRNVLTEQNLSGTSRSAIKTLAPFEESMFKTEKDVFEILKRLREQEPKKGLNELLMLCRDTSLEKLQKTQSKTMSTIKTLTRELPQDSPSKAALTTVLDEAEALIANDLTATERTFKRKVFIEKLDNVRASIPRSKPEEKRIFNAICRTSQELKTSENNIHAFIVKYSGRSSTEIGQRLVEPSVSTFEHIIPESQDGEMILNNCLAVSKKFNKKRATMPYDKFIELHPYVPKNCQKYMDCVIDLIRKHKYKEYASYPKEIAIKLFTDSKGLINLDYSRLGKLQPATPAMYRKQTTLVAV